MSTNVTFVNIEELQPAATALGMGDIPPGELSPQVVKGLEALLKTALTTQWKVEHPAEPLANTAFGTMGPWTDDLGGTAPACAVQEIGNSLRGWKIPYDPDLVNQMAVEITTQIAGNSGITGTYFGSVDQGPNVSVDYAVGYTAAALETGSTDEGVIYTFGAALSFDAETRREAAAAALA